MKHSALSSGVSGDAFTDLLFNALLGFAMMFIIAFMLIQEPVADGNVDAKAEMLITATWPDGHPDDITCWLRDHREKWSGTTTVMET